ncbi:hypothetical protein N7452_006311 [Penicillium brevicompactum]|uniref:Uncharacterized protein n=1 Tax=Penicillium brevicompactum TaxID=5074 RepID=A0A9W9QKH1_PENBR|nr:hypothetical protein N7452_006311 [Penicillium brevicompactum]
MYGQSGPHRSSPEWRLPQEQEPHSQPPPPPPRPPALYTPATYGPISNPGASSSGTDTTAWGVRFNQHHAPPLPPRPSSTNEQPHAYLQKQPHPYNPDGGASFGTQPSVIHSTPPPYTQTPAVPPPPPKIPQGQHAPAEQYGHPARPPLLAQGVGPAAMTGSYAFRPPLVNTNTSFTGASALGPGTPSDWEHLGPSPGDFDDAAWFPPRRTPPPEELAPFPEPPSMPNGPATNASDVHFRPRTDTNGTFASSISNVTQSGQNSSNSPVSPCTSQGVPAPPAIVRVDSTEPAMAMAGRTNTIDSVMDAWARPISPAAKTTSPVYADPTHRAHSVGPANRTTSPVERTQVHVDPLSAERLRSPTDTSAQMPERPPSVGPSKNPDPFEDLDPWSKSSLERFVAMLRKEAVADLDQERYQIFTAFMAKETKLREILYNIEHEPEVTQTPARSLDSTPQPMSNRGSSKVPIESGLIPVASEEEVPLSGTATTEDEDTDDVRSEYSSGGRPIFAGRQGSQYLPRLSKLPSVAEPATGISRTSSFPSSADVQKQVLEPLATNPPRPIYTPFQYTEGPQRGSDDLKFDRPAYQAYSDLRQAAVNGRIMSNGPAPASRSNSNAAAISPIMNERDETFLGLIRHKSVAYITPAERKATPLPLLPEALQKSRPHSLVDDLRAIVWKPLDKQSESSWHITTREELRRFSDDFSYIQQSTDRWEQAAAARRKKLDQERMLRQEESEEQIDDLFNGKSIGYADINTLEEEFRQAEARVQLEEERREVESFIDEVFNPLDEGLKNDILELRKSYDSALNQLDRDQKSKSSASERQSSPSVTMKMVNEIHNKLEIRFQKRLDIALDCERRRKKAERRPLVFMGDMPNLRKLDAEFDQMERRNILEAYKDRDDRANRLMDSFDDAILHGLGMNQSLLDEVASKAAQLDPAALRASGLSDSEIEQILKSAATFAASLLADSEAILRNSGEADMALNDADYGVSVAEARYAASDPDIFHRLADEKKKEDEKMQSELDSKLHSIQKGPKKIETMIEKLLLDLKNSPPSEARRSPVPASAPTSPSPDVILPFSLRSSSTAPIPANATPLSSQDGDSGHKERIRRALEEAKKRNASRTQ